MDGDLLLLVADHAMLQSRRVLGGWYVSLSTSP